jgi:hypothetical protein
MRKKITPLFILFFLVLFSFSCKDKKNEEPYIDIVPGELEIPAYNNQKLVFTINVFSDYQLTSFIITKKFEGGPESIIFDSILSIKNFNFQWAFTTPDAVEDDLILYFKATNENGVQSVVGKRLTFSGNQFKETTGLKIYSANSGKEVAFDLVALKPVSLSAETSVRDIQELQSDTINAHLSNKWVSPSGCEFVRFSDYDYGKANSSSARAAFQAGINLTEISNIAVGDILIVKITRLAPAEEYAVVKITSLIDQEGKANDFYEISVKK